MYIFMKISDIMCKQYEYQLLQNGECLGWHVCHSTFFIFTFALKVVCLRRHRRRHRRNHLPQWHRMSTRSARSARSVITLAEVVETPVVVSTATLVTGVAVGLVYSCVDDPSTLSIAITASVLIAASLSQGSKGKEKETQAEKLGSLHVWFDQMVSTFKVARWISRLPIYTQDPPSSEKPGVTTIWDNPPSELWSTGLWVAQLENQVGAPDVNCAQLELCYATHNWLILVDRQRLHMVGSSPIKKCQTLYRWFNIWFQRTAFPNSSWSPTPSW